MTLVTITPANGLNVITGDLFGEPATTGAAGQWGEQERSLRDPVLTFQSRELLGGGFGVVLTGNVADKVRWLRRFARGQEGVDTSTATPVTVHTEGAWDLDAVRHPSWLWVIRGVEELDDDLLDYGPRGVRRQHVVVTVSRWTQREAVFRRGGKPLTEAAQVKGYTTVTAKDVKYGLLFVSLRVYGTGARVGDLMRLNQITNPKALKVGQKIKLP